MKTYQAKKKDIQRNWHLFDAAEKPLGRLASEIATHLIGKNKVKYTSHLDMGDYVVVVNASQVKVTGNKRKQKLYRSHSGYLGGLKEVKFEKWLEEQPEKIIEHAVSGMLPRNRLHSPRMRRLKVFAGSEHKYEDKFKKKK